MKYLIILFILVASGAGIWIYMNKSAREAAAANASNVPTRPVSRTNLEKVITANGKIASNRDVDIKCKASGEIIKLPFDISQTVHKGDMLLELDPVDEERSLKQAKVKMDSSQAKVEQSKLTYQQASMAYATSTTRANAELASAKANAADSHSKAARTQALFEAKPTPLSSKEELETAQTKASLDDVAVTKAETTIAELAQTKVALDSKLRDIDLAQGQLEQDKISYELAQQQLEYTKVIAPVDGVVSVLNVQVGNIVQSGSAGFSGGTTVMTLSDLSHIYVLASVDESDIGSITDPATGKPGQRAHVTVDAYPRMVFEGQVVRVASKGVNTSNVVTFEVKVEVTDERKSLLKPEMTGTAKIVTDSREDVLVVPVQAFMRKQEEAKSVASTQPNTDAVTSQPATRSGDSPRGRGGRGGGGRGGRGGGGAAGLPDDRPQEGTVNILVDGKQVTKEVTVGMSNGELYEVVKGDVQEGDEVVLNAFNADSKWRNNGPSAQQMGRMLGGGGGGGGRGR